MMDKTPGWNVLKANTSCDCYQCDAVIDKDETAAFDLEREVEEDKVWWWTREVLCISCWKKRKIIRAL